MIRFVDLGKQLGLDDQHPHEFAFYTTVSDTFISLGGDCVWESWEEFEKSHTLQFPHDDTTWPLRRFKSLCPEWVFDLTSAGGDR